MNNTGAFIPASIDYRYPSEHKLLAGTIAVSILALILFTTITVGTLLILLLLGLVINYFSIRASIEGYKRSAVRVSANQFPEIKAIVDRCRVNVPIPADTQVFVSYSPVMNAFATGFGQPYLIMLNSALVESLSEEELATVIGHEMGHIHFGHTTLLTLIGQLGNQTFGIPLFGDMVRFVFLFWSRACELTADRAGMVASGNVQAAVATEIKLGVGPELAKKVNFAELARQAGEARGSLLGMWGEMQATHPMMITRIQKMFEFAASPVFHQLRPDAAVNRGMAANMPAAAQAATCPHCGRKVEPGWKFCNACGKDLRSPVG